MRIQNILCPIDFSTNNELAVAYASSLAQVFNARLHFVHAYEPAFAYSDAEAIALYSTPPDLDPIRERLANLKPTVDDVAFDHEVLFGFPGSVLLDYAREHQVDLIVMATHGRSGLSRVLLGSVAETVMRHAGCPVMTIRVPSDDTPPKAGE